MGIGLKTGKSWLYDENKHHRVRRPLISKYDFDQEIMEIMPILPIYSSTFGQMGMCIDGVVPGLPGPGNKDSTCLSLSLQCNFMTIASF